MLRLADLAHEQGWALVILDLRIDTTTPTGRMMLTVLAAVAQLERDLTAERTTAALQAAKRRGQRLGAPVSDNTRRAGIRAVELRDGGMTWRQVADQLRLPERGIGEASFVDGEASFVDTAPVDAGGSCGFGDVGVIAERGEHVLPPGGPAWALVRAWMRARHVRFCVRFAGLLLCEILPVQLRGEGARARCRFGSL